MFILDRDPDSGHSDREIQTITRRSPMATFDSYTHGQFNWVDLMSKDMAGAKAFYTGLFGWDVADQDTQGWSAVCHLSAGRPTAMRAWRNERRDESLRHAGHVEQLHQRR